jgi:hypothetical protein
MRRFLTFEEAEHSGYGRYAIDWDTEQKYKEPLSGVRIYENGVVHVSRNGYRDPNWRKCARRDFGLNFVLKKDLTGIEFYCPNTGVRVHKKSINADILLRDDALGRVYSIANWGNDAAVRFVSEHAQPMGGLPLTYYVPNPQREAERLAVFSPMFELGATLRAVSGETDVLQRYQMQWHLEYDAKLMIYGEIPPPRTLRSEKAQAICKSLAECEPYARDLIRRESRDKYEPNYLLIKEK